MKNFLANVWTFIISLIVAGADTVIWLIWTIAGIAQVSSAIASLGIANLVWLGIMIAAGVFIGLHFWAKKK